MKLRAAGCDEGVVIWVGVDFKVHLLVLRIFGGGGVAGAGSVVVVVGCWFFGFGARSSVRALCVCVCMCWGRPCGCSSVLV